MEKNPIFRNRSGRFAYGVLLSFVLLTIVAFLSTPVLAWRWFKQPFLGLFLEQNNVISTTGRDDWAGLQAGIAHPEQVVAIDGRALTTPTGLPVLLDGHRIGDTVALSLRTPEGNQRIVSIPLTRFQVQDWAFYFIVPYLIGLVYLLIGLWVFRAGGRRPATWSFAFFCTLAAPLMGAFFDLHTSHWLTVFWSGAIPLLGAAIVHMALTFPEPLIVRRPRLPIVLVYTSAIALVVYTSLTCVNMAAPWSYISSMRLSYLFSVLAVLFLMASHIYRLRIADSSVRRRQSRAILLGSLFSFAPLFIWMLAEGLHISVRFYAILFLPFLVIFPLAVGYAILRYRLRDLDNVLSRGLAHLTVVLALLIVFFTLTRILSSYLSPTLTASNPIVLTLFILFSLGIFHPLRRRVEHLVDRLLIRSTVDYGQVLGDFSRQLTTILDLSRVLELVARRVQDTLHPTGLAVFLLEQNTDLYRLAWAHSQLPSTGPPGFAGDGALARHLKSTLEPLYFPAGEVVPDLLQGEWAHLQALDLILCVPLQRQKQLSGWLAFGPRQSGRSFSSNDLDFLAALANQSALAIENARLYTELQSRLEELERTQAHLLRSEKMASLGRLAADVAHEIGNPLTYIYGYLEMLDERTPADASEYEYVQAALRQMDRITTLLQQLLQVSRPSRQSWERTDVNLLIHAVLGLIDKKLTYQEIELFMEFDPDLPPIMADAGQLEQVLLNLAINASNAMPDGGSLRLSTRCQDGAIVINVEDTGMGIPPENLDRVFEPFFTTSEEGSGLGLAISYNIVTSHGGQIEVQSVVGQGTCFTVSLPLGLPA